MRARILAGGVAATLLIAAGPAAADHGDANPPWPSLLPARDVPAGHGPHPVENCEEISIACADDLARRLDEQWTALDARCDHRAVASLSYLRITQALRDDLGRPHPRFFPHPDWMLALLTTFSNRYFAAFADYEAGRPVPEAWRIAYDATTKGDISAGQDVLLFSNAHVQHDLPFAIEEMGLRSPEGESYKPDHDGINEINTRILDPTQDEVAERYDPTFSLVDLKPSPLDELGATEVVKVWREGAWRNAERLVTAGSAAERKQVIAGIDLTSRLWAEAIAAGEMPGFRAMRDDYCRAQQAARG